VHGAFIDQREELMPDPARVPWQQQPGENDLWYSRFIRFVALGPGRSVSLAATGRRNAYPVPAHWPIQAKQHDWRPRARAFDEAVTKDPELIAEFNQRLQTLATTAPNGEGDLLTAALKAGGYIQPADDLALAAER
jgi:hypothetical protein